MNNHKFNNSKMINYSKLNNKIMKLIYETYIPKLKNNLILMIL